ncbi:MAG: L,D-transpeptidase family protein [Patescibacteria group bacterium]|jgi:hypothetical protein
MFKKFFVIAIKPALVLFLLSFIFFGQQALAQTMDSDNDGLTDDQEINIYHTDPFRSDTDKDSYFDKAELDKGFSPHRPGYKLSQLDWDKDGLSDELELKFGTDLKNSDSDADGYTDGDEVKKGFNPKSSDKTKLFKKIEINLAKQELNYYLGSVSLATFKVSSGKPGWDTPKGNFKIEIKTPLAWSKAAGLWMPYWMAFVPTGKFGLHELPYWPNGYREGENHLGMPASHGCVRLGIGFAKILYDWAEIGTPVMIY